ncbi:LppU/SCO3897 family protein [Streptomyces triticiradicis]|uniref:Uncharacterized protein n=1 Tax=Streptomyces triticiradicis TaxID=2651189 RepID=A0A7J5DBF2_9ACTN|nr:hypothetical protein [Streptomyces triticiradicis]KAB1986150.1 hypothetical protein F8144_23865 [Streptomyces triticiradicis]
MRAIRIVWHASKLLVGAIVLLGLAGGFVYGAFFADNDKSSDPEKQPVPVAGDCIAADRPQPIAVSCDDPTATVEVISVLDGDSPELCQYEQAATDVLTYESVLKVGGADGIDVGDTERKTLCVKKVDAQGSVTAP